MPNDKIPVGDLCNPNGQNRCPFLGYKNGYWGAGVSRDPICKLGIGYIDYAPGYSKDVRKAKTCLQRKPKIVFEE